MKDTEPTGLTVDLLLAKLICEPKAGFVDFELHMDSDGKFKITLLSKHPDGTTVPLGKWEGVKGIVWKTI